ncbi:polysaccharide biosynthesis/export family protein [Aquimarina agarivorans]|uniref:polysaccharide biosynthesis/export family protein n=1 Tax=Aquimarina agarivorans TaxID=980584 RepID=UPI000248EB38|nr:polysaccharide biosynthesis/export family protein [Aquimarina agarivorans]
MSDIKNDSKVKDKKIVLLVVLIAFLVSCASKKDILLLQDIDNIDLKKDGVFNIPKIRNNDLLSITVSSVDKKSAAPFNLPVVATGSQNMVTGSQQLQSYLVDANGNVEFPVLGTVHLSGLSKTDAVDYLKQEISKYVKNPIVNLRITNFKISVLGEVSRPGTFSIQDERITILEALSLAGDMTVYGKRKGVLVIREEEGKKLIISLILQKLHF